MVQLLIYNANSKTKRSNNNTKSYFQKKNISKKIIFKKSEFYLVTTKQVPSIPMEKGTLQPQSPRVLRRVSSNNATSLLVSTSNVQLLHVVVLVSGVKTVDDPLYIPKQATVQKCQKVLHLFWTNHNYRSYSCLRFYRLLNMNQ